MERGRRGRVRRDVVVRWADAYSASKNFIGAYDVIHPRTGKVIGQKSWLSPHELEDYMVLGTRFEIEKRCGQITNAAIVERRRLRQRAWIENRVIKMKTGNMRECDGLAEVLPGPLVEVAPAPSMEVVDFP
jgi:hypothetical protein